LGWWDWLNWKHAQGTAIDLAIQFGSQLMVALLILALAFLPGAGLRA